MDSTEATIQPFDRHPQQTDTLGASVSVHDSIEGFLQHRRLRGLSPASIELYRYSLMLWQSWRQTRAYPAALASVLAEELRSFFRYLAEERVPHASNSRRPAAARVGLSVNARDSIWRVLRALWTWLGDEELLRSEQQGYFRRDRIPRPRAGDDDLAGDRHVADDELVAALLQACGDPVDELAARNRAIILLLYESGMRVSELCAVEDRQIQLVERQARIRGKGGRRRYIFWSDGASAALRRYLALRNGAFGSGPLLRGLSSRNSGDRMTPNAVRGMLRRLAEDANVTLPAGAPVHGFRAGFAQNMLDNGVDGLDLQQLLGHSDIRTTTIYVRRSPGRLRDVYRRATGRDSGVRRRRSGNG